jgi:UPF0271 protein
LDSSLALDAAAFYTGISFLSSDEKTLYTTEEVLSEVRHIKSSHSALETLMEAGKLKIRAPTAAQLEKVKAGATRTGDFAVLSPADFSIVALALELDTVLVTDDFAVANVASVLGVSVIPATPGKKIKETRKWISYCSACAKTFGGQKECPICGNMLKRKYRKITR